MLTSVLACAVVGLLVGSFANVAIHRWPRGGSVRIPNRSHCPACDHELLAADNVPVASWLMLRGRCRHCQAPISGRYPVVEASTAILFALVTWRQFGSLAVLPALALTWALVVATVIDIEHRIIPNVLTYRLPFLLLGLLAVAAGAGGTWADLQRGVVFGLVLPGGMLLLSEAFRLLRGKQGIGMGDVKLAVSIGLVLGYLGGAEVVAFVYLSMIGAVLVAVGLLAIGRAKLASRIPFGPYLAFGALATMIGGDDLAELVRSLFGV